MPEAGQGSEVMLFPEPIPSTGVCRYPMVVIIPDDCSTGGRVERDGRGPLERCRWGAEDFHIPHRWGVGMIRVGLIGYGHWGPKLARCFSQALDFSLAAICDVSADRLGLAGSAHAGVRLVNDWRELVADPGIDAIAVATPAAIHAPIALAALGEGKHVLVEKPLGRSVQEAEALVREARSRGRVLMVDHTFIFSPAVRAIRKLLDEAELGEPRYFDSVRIGAGIVREDVNVLWDLAVHDLSILHHVLPAAPCAVQANGLALNGMGREQIAYLTLRYAAPFIAHMHVNWRAPEKTRRMLIGGTRRVLVYDDLDAEATVRVHDGAVPGMNGHAVGAHPAGPWSPPLERVEPLAAVVRHFGDCIARGGVPLSDAGAALRVVRLLEAADRSLAAGGNAIAVNGDGAMIA